jgi:hypothetical protein
MFCKNINFICSHSFQMKCLIFFMYVLICFVENSKIAETGRLSFQVSRTDSTCLLLSAMSTFLSTFQVVPETDPSL